MPDDIDLTDAVEAGVQALRAAGLADADGDGFVLENVYAHGAITVALEAALPAIREQLTQQIGSEALRDAAEELTSYLQQSPTPTLDDTVAGWLRSRADALTETGKSTSERIADTIEAEENRLRRLTPGHADWQTPDFRMGMLHAAAIVRAES